MTHPVYTDINIRHRFDAENYKIELCKIHTGTVLVLKLLTKNGPLKIHIYIVLKFWDKMFYVRSIFTETLR